MAEKFRYSEPIGVDEYRMMPGETTTPYEEHGRRQSAEIANAAEDIARQNDTQLTDAQGKDVWQKAYLEAEIARRERSARPDNKTD